MADYDGLLELDLAAEVFQHLNLRGVSSGQSLRKSTAASEKSKSVALDQAVEIHDAVSQAP